MTVHLSESTQSLLLGRSTGMRRPAHKWWKSFTPWLLESFGGIFRAIRRLRTSRRKSLSSCLRVLKSSAERVRLNTGLVGLQLSLVTNLSAAKNLDRYLSFLSWTWTIPKMLQSPLIPMLLTSSLLSLPLNFCKNYLRLSNLAIKWSSAFFISRKNQSRKLPAKRDGAPQKLK